MAIIDSRLHAHVARIVERRSATELPAITVASVATQTPTTIPGVAGIPSNTRALIAVIAVLLVIIFGIVAWRIWAWRVRKRAQNSGPTSNEKRTSKASLFNLSGDAESTYERPRTLVLNVPMANPEAVWMPQVRPWAPVTRGSENASEVAKEKMQEANALDSPPASVASVRTPPPAYNPAARFGPPAPPPANTTLPAPPSLLVPPPLKSVFEAETPITPNALNALPSPVASPARTSSFAFQQMQPPVHDVNRSTSISSDSSSPKDPNRLPRTMVVAQTFAPTMGDELTVAVGERVRMLEEYADGWCLAERGSERGVVPRFCLGERERRAIRSSPAVTVTPPQGSI